MTILGKVTGVQSNLVSHLFQFLSADLFRIGAWGEKHTCESTLFDSDDHVNFFLVNGFSYFGPL